MAPGDCRNGCGAARQPLALAVFDLDDTLIDTRGRLLPEALDRVARATGLPRERLDARGKSIAEVLRGAGELAPEVRAAAAAAWYDSQVPPLEPLPGARKMLAALRGRIRLALLTRGDPERQRRKIEACGLGPRFERIQIRPVEAAGTKREDLAALLAWAGVPPSRCAVIGDDPADELRWGRELGCLVVEVPGTPLDRIPRLLEEAGLLRPAPEHRKCR